MTAPRWPHYDLTAAADGSTTIQGPAVRPGPYRDHDAALAQLARIAEHLGRPVPATATGPDQHDHHLLIQPDATVEADPAPPSCRARAHGRRARAGRPRAAAEPQHAPQQEQIDLLLARGELDQAAAVAAQLDDATALQHGPSHPDALSTRTQRAQILARQGHLTAAVHLYQDVADRWALAGDHTRAREAADTAHRLLHRANSASVSR
jgi:hypothetical protein